MAYTKKFQNLADIAMTEVVSVSPEQVNELLAQGAVALDIRDKEEHDAGHLVGSLQFKTHKLKKSPSA
jgi:predicted sulfurtransferase